MRDENLTKNECGGVKEAAGDKSTTKRRQCFYKKDDTFPTKARLSFFQTSGHDVKLCKENRRGQG